MKGLPCVECGKVPSEEEPSHNAHTENGGISRKADYTKIIPLCFGCHSIANAYGWGSFSEGFADSLEYFAAQTEKLWQSNQHKESE